MRRHAARRPVPPLRRRTGWAPAHSSSKPLYRQSSGSSARAATAVAWIGEDMRSRWHVVSSADTPDSDVPEQFRIRQGKRERLLAEGRDPTPVQVARTHSLAEIRAAYPELPADTETGQIVGVMGRVVFARNSGKLCFATLQEGTAPSCRP